MHPAAARVIVVAALAAAFASCAGQPSTAEDERAVTEALESFYGAMGRGDAAAAMDTIAPDAMFVESGRLETREQYEESHLPADIEFETQVTGRRTIHSVKVEGDTAWVIATTDYDGTFNDRPVKFVGAQLAVLTRQEGRWRIRSIHWSSLRT